MASPLAPAARRPHNESGRVTADRVTGRAAKAPRAHLSVLQARAVAIAAQGLNAGRPDAPSRRDLRNVIGRIGFLQIDSVNIMVRAHYMPLFSRLGAYDRDHLETDSYHRRERRLFEYWAHEACLIPLDMQPLFRWRMAAAARGEDIYNGLARFARERKTFVADVLAAVRQQGPVAASGIKLGAVGAPGWWGWSDAKTALEYLFWAGEVTTLRRETAGFARIYDLTERVLPAAILNLPTPEPAQAQRTLLLHAAKALGVATATDLREYFRLPADDSRKRIHELVEAGELTPVTVEGWGKPAYALPGLAVPRKAGAVALLSPFDPLLSERGRAERLFDFHYRIEIYTPAHKRQYGYYCLPLLLGDRIVARLDLKADRATGVLRIESAHAEHHADAEAVAAAAQGELERMAAWLGLGDVVVANRRGPVAAALARHLG